MDHQNKTLKLMMPMSEELWRQLFSAAGIVATSSWVITSTKQARNRMDRMQAMGKKPKGEQQTYDFATMYTQLKLFAEDAADPNAPESREVR